MAPVGSSYKYCPLDLLGPGTCRVHAAVGGSMTRVGDGAIDGMEDVKEGTTEPKPELGMTDLGDLVLEGLKGIVPMPDGYTGLVPVPVGSR